MNKTFRKLAAITPRTKEIGTRLFGYPFTIGVNANNEVVKTLEGKKTFADFSDDVVLLNICHKNGKTTVIKK